jgi:hypothetical protein
MKTKLLVYRRARFKQFDTGKKLKPRALSTQDYEAYGGNLTSRNGEQYIDWGTTFPATQTNCSVNLRSRSSVPTARALCVVSRIINIPLSIAEKTAKAGTNRKTLMKS